MTFQPKRFLAAGGVLVIAGMTAGCQQATRAQQPAAPSGDAPAVSITLAPLTGTASCSGRACHGAIGPVPGQTVQQNEFLTWCLQDKHKDAYNILLSERSRLIAKNLGIQKAEEDARCLACHCTPQLANPAGTSRLLDERRLGVGCEACHGPAEKYLGPHTSPTWKTMAVDQKKKEYARYGMYWLQDRGACALVCAGCHVGAPADPVLKIPARDLNHDLLGAGHPRINFEFGAYLANLPRHWIEKEQEPTAEARIWALGQLASAEAALKLLADRTSPGRPWPEFAEYDCYACHHDLREPSWRQARGYEHRLPGSLPFNDWYLAMLPHVPGGSPPAVLGDLAKAMNRSMPDRQEVAQKAREAAGQLAAWRRKIDPGKVTRDSVRKTIGILGMEGAKLARLDWDHTEQLALALVAFNQAYRDDLARAKQEPTAADQEVHAAIGELVRKLAFPPGAEGPTTYRIDPAFSKDLDAIFQRIR